MKKATRSLESHFKNLKEEKKNSKVFVEYWEKGNKKRTTRSLESHFKNFKKETKN
jgi:lipopolysaccharide biosynthesis protein